MNAMKKCLGMFGLVLAMCFATAATAQNNNALEGKARGALGACLTGYQVNSIYTVTLTVAPVNCVTEPCPYDAVVTAVACPSCPPDQPICPLPPCLIIGEVYFLNGQIVQVNSICNP